MRTVTTRIAQLRKSAPADLPLDVKVPAFVIGRLVAEVTADNPRVDRNESRSCERLSEQWCREGLRDRRNVGEGASRWIGLDGRRVLRVSPGHVLAQHIRSGAFHWEIGHSEAPANDRGSISVRVVSEPEAWAQVVPASLQSSGVGCVHARVNKPQICQVKIRQSVLLLGGRSKYFPAQSQVQRESSGDFPIVLKPSCVLVIGQVIRGQQKSTRTAGEVTQHQSGESVSVSVRQRI